MRWIKCNRGWTMFLLDHFLPNLQYSFTFTAHGKPIKYFSSVEKMGTFVWRQPYTCAVVFGCGDIAR